ncbi:hypothetical protein EMN47_18600 [Prolixibacteraceae bacterium JC049]|nr:hypothetical protein [Prolixibacteraceae bacterium JC049]
MYIANFFVDGGLPGMSFITIMAVGGAIAAIKVIVDLFNKKKSNKLWLEAIIMLPAIGFFFGLLYQALGMMEAMNVITEVKDISPVLIWKGFYVSLMAPVYAMCLFLAFSIIWYVVRIFYKKAE